MIFCYIYYVVDKYAILLIVNLLYCSSILLGNDSLHENGLKINKTKTALSLNLSHIKYKEGKGLQSKLFNTYYSTATLYSLLEKEDSAFYYLDNAYNYSNDISTIDDYFFFQYRSKPKWKELFDKQLLKFKTENKHLKKQDLAIQIIRVSGSDQSMLVYARYYRGTNNDLNSMHKEMKAGAKLLITSISKNDYPVIEDISESGLEHLFLLIQHCNNIPLQQTMLAKMKAAVEKNPGDNQQLNPNIAYLEDRILINEHKAQLYGTQFNSKGVLFPIHDSAKVDIRRKQMGLEPLAKYLNSFR